MNGLETLRDTKNANYHYLVVDCDNYERIDLMNPLNRYSVIILGFIESRAAISYFILKYSVSQTEMK